VSERAALQIPYDAIMDVTPVGALVFLITDIGALENDTPARRFYRRWQGYAPIDTTYWHTAIYEGPRKDSKGSRYRPYIIHSSQRGTTCDQLPPEFFKNTTERGLPKQNRIEILANPDFGAAEHQVVVEYCRDQLGKPFDGDPGWKRDWPTVVFGVRSRRRLPQEVSCHGLAYDAYAAAGMRFPHHLERAPNLLGRLLGAPLGHPRDHVDLDYLYLRDHHLYRDPRFACLISVAGAGPSIRDVVIERAPRKYGWSPALQKLYEQELAARSPHSSGALSYPPEGATEPVPLSSNS
jgi:hypothetical protein